MQAVGRQSRTPLNIMVHNDRPLQVAVMWKATT